MTTLLFTAFDAAYLPLADITVPRMRDYAKRHGYEFNVITNIVKKAGNDIIEWPDAIYWAKVHGAIDFLEEGFDRVIWLDVDQLITNPSITIDVPDYGFHVSRDWGEDAQYGHQFSVCGFVAHKDCVDLIREWIDMEPECRGKPFPEQEPLRRIYLGGAYRKLMHIHPRKLFNSVPDAICPDNVPEPWSPEDFAAHLTMLPIEERVNLAKEIINEKAKPVG